MFHKRVLSFVGINNLGFFLNKILIDRFKHLLPQLLKTLFKQEGWDIVIVFCRYYIGAITAKLVTKPLACIGSQKRSANWIKTISKYFKSFSEKCNQCNFQDLYL